MEKKINNFNYNPSGIDRTQDMFVLEMRSGINRFVDKNGIPHTGTPTAEQAPNGFTVLSNAYSGYHMIFDVHKSDKCISFVRYFVQSASYSYKSFKECVENDNVLRTVGTCQWGTRAEALNAYNDWMTINFYKDGRVAAVATFVPKCGTIKRSFQIDLTALPSMSWDIWQRIYLAKLGLQFTEEEQERLTRYYYRREEEFNRLDVDKLVTEVWSDDDIVPQQLTKKDAKIAYGFLVSSGMSATLLYEHNNVTREILYLPEEWMEFFPDLKDVRLETARKIAREEFNDHRLEDRSSYGDGPDKFYPSILFANAGISESYLNRKTKTVTNLNEIWDANYDDKLKNMQSSIKRVNDSIVVSVNGDDHSYYHEHYLFIYDTKKNSRKLYLKRDREASPKQVPLTDSNIHSFTNEVCANLKEDYGCFGKDSKIFIRGNIDEILDKTTCKWIMQGVKNNTLPNLEEAEKAWLLYLTKWNSGTRQYDCSGISVVGWVTSQETHPALWFHILVDVLAREKLYMEQIAKCGLWNIFSNCIIHADWNANEGSVAAKEGDACLVFNVKGKSLTNSLGLRMDQLRVIDKFSGREEGSRRSGRQVHIGAALAALGVTAQELKALDIRTFERVITICTSIDDTDSYYSSSSIVQMLCSRYGSHHLRDFIRSIDGISRKLSFIEKYFLDSGKKQDVGNIDRFFHEFNDYIDMREQLKRMLEMGANANCQEDIEDLKTFEKDYPALPDSSTIFQRYTRGGRLRVERWGGDTTVGNEYDFIDYYNRNYPTGSVKQVWEDGTLLGVVLNLSPKEKVKFLHDEISVELSRRKDSNNAKQFAKAYEVAKKMEYISENYGLRIIAPATPHELKREGNVLSHCVGSYVDAVCRGVEKILFIRRNDMPYDPYFTLDVAADGTIRQVHCYRNGDPTPEGIRLAYQNSGQRVYDQNKDIIGFLTEWAKKTPGVKLSSIQKRYGCLCALVH